MDAIQRHFNFKPVGEEFIYMKLGFLDPEDYKNLGACDICNFWQFLILVENVTFSRYSFSISVCLTCFHYL